MYAMRDWIGLSSTLFACLGLVSFALVLTFCSRYWKFIRAFKHFPSKRLERAYLWLAIMGRCPKDVPFTKVFFQDLIKQCKEFQREGFCLLWFFRPYLLIYNEEFSKTFFKLAVGDKSSIYHVTKDVLGNGLISSEEATWKVHRKLLNPAFVLGVLKGKMHIFNENAANLVGELQKTVDKPTENLLFILKYHTFNIMTESILGLKLDDEKFGSKAANYLKIMDEVIDFIIYKVPRPWLYREFLLRLFPCGRNYLHAVAGVRRFTEEIIEELQNSVDEKEKNHSDCDEEIRQSFAQILIEQNRKDPSFTIDDIRDHLITFMVAGYDTSSHALMWCLYLLGHNQDVQEKAYKEVETVIMAEDVTFDHLAKLKYLDCVIKESLRLYSTVPIYGRKLNKEVECGKYTVPKGTEILFVPFLLHRNPDIYPNPEKFDPERFAESSEVRPWTYLPFAEGYRSCIGKKFAMMEMKVLLVHVIRHFQITTLYKLDDSDLDWSIILKPANPIPMLFTLRQS